MPLDKEKMRAYQAKRRAKLDAEAQLVRRPASTGNPLLGPNYDPAIANTPGHEHYWRRRAGEEYAECIFFEYQGRMIGGCHELRKYEGKLLNPYTDGRPDSAQLIRDSKTADAIHKKMPVTKTRA